jgi:hypothetical protein
MLNNNKSDAEDLTTLSLDKLMDFLEGELNDLEKYGENTVKREWTKRRGAELQRRIDAGEVSAEHETRANTLAASARWG